MIKMMYIIAEKMVNRTLSTIPQSCLVHSSVTLQDGQWRKIKSKQRIVPGGGLLKHKSDTKSLF